MQNGEKRRPASLLAKASFLLFYRATALQQGNSFPSCAWHNILFRTRFSWFDHIFTTAAPFSTIRGPPPGWCAWNWRARPFTMNRGWMRAGCTTRYATGRGSRGSNIRIPPSSDGRRAPDTPPCAECSSQYMTPGTRPNSGPNAAGCTVAPADASPGRMNNPFYSVMPACRISV